VCDLLPGTDYHHRGMQFSAMTLLSLPSPWASFLLDLLFDPEDGGDMFLQNVGLSLNYMITTQKTLSFLVVQVSCHCILLS
jgi:hypothetical protein